MRRISTVAGTKEVHETDGCPDVEAKCQMLPRSKHSADGLTGEDWSGWISSNGAREGAEISRPSDEVSGSRYF